MFTDNVTIKVTAGKGGNGIIAWRREKHLAKGGPYGGNGGRGGSIYIQASSQIFSLDHYRNRRLLKTENGHVGGINTRRGRSGKDLIIQVPCGTLVIDKNSKNILHDLTKENEKVLLCAGGRGGLGNRAFKTDTNQAPNYCTEGKLGDELHVELELKLIADIGLVGFPNAGKSTLINALTNVPVKMAAYPFTTLRPNLGMLHFEDYSRLLMADIPGIIEGAHHNKGLGFKFLRHIERTKLFVYVLDASGIDGRTPTEDFRVLQNEIKKYNPKMLERPFLVLLNKLDDDCSKDHVIEFKKTFPDLDEKLFEISALQKEGTSKVKDQFYQIFSLLNSEKFDLAL